MKLIRGHILFLLSAIGLMACVNSSGDATVHPPGRAKTPEANVVKGAQVYASCIACHGAKGEGKLEMNAPSIGHQEDWYVERQLKAFRSGVRAAHPLDSIGRTMTPFAKMLSDNDITDLNGYLKTLNPPPPEPTITGNVSRGKALYNDVCGSCHGAKAQGNLALNSPRLTGTQDGYLKRQLQNYKNDIRGTHPDDTYGAQMHPMAALLVDEESIDNVVAYIQTLQP